MRVPGIGDPRRGRCVHKKESMTKKNKKERKKMKTLKVVSAAAVVASMIGFCQVAEGRAYEPKAPADAVAAACYRRSTAPAVNPLEDAFKKAFAGAMAKDNNAAQFDKFVKDAGLEGKSLEWVVGTVGGANLVELMKKDKVPEGSIALRIDHDAAKLAAAIKASADKDESVADIEVAGLKAWKIVSPKLAEDGMTPVFTSLDGQLVLVATEQKALARLVKLYRDGEGVNAAFASLASGSGEVVRLFIPKFGKRIVDFAKGNGSDLSELDQMIPDGKRLVSNLGDFDLAFLAAGSAASVKASVIASTADDAETIRTLVKTSLMPLKASLKEEQDEDSKLALEVLNGVKVGGEGKTAVVTVPVPAKFIKMIADAAIKSAN